MMKKAGGKKLKYIKEFLFNANIFAKWAFLAVLLASLRFFEAEWTWSLTIIGGYFFFKASEYFNHRFVFHHPLFRKYLPNSILRQLHDNHHHHPNELKYLFMPLWYAIPLPLISGILVYFLIGGWAFAITFNIGLMTGFLQYEWMHFTFHRPIEVSSEKHYVTKRQHLAHHFQSEQKGFAITGNRLDKIFGTSEKFKE